ncbi:MAG: hypothetical protein CML19_10540 [Pusillimonas sp.]|nr:hypothetical protein [Pusillimonas sp.]|tara:strand:+ start:245 stop:529 length:285 start_codon:yes stop_codon:yes gene_type:complete
MRKRNITKEEKGLVVKLYQQGMSYSKIAKKINRQVGSVCSVLKDIRAKRLDFPKVTQNPNDPLSWGSGFKDQNLNIKSKTSVSALSLNRKYNDV